MTLSLNAPAFSFKTSRRLLYRGLLLLLTLPLPAGTLSAQSEQETKRAEANRLFKEAVQLYQEGSKNSLEMALQKFERARSLFQSVNHASGEVNALFSIGAVYSSLREQQKALDNFALALPLFRAIGDRLGEATTRTNIGAIYSDSGEQQKALDNFALALPLFHAIGDRLGEATTLINIGRVYSHLGEQQKALDNYALALPLFRAINDRGGEAATLTNIGAVYSDLGEQQKALDNYTLALPLFRAVGDRRGEATTLNNIGLVYGHLGERQKALDNFALALPLFRAIGDRRGEAITLTNIGAIYSDSGEQQKALDNFALALSLRRAINDRDGEAVTLFSVAYVERDQGKFTEARSNIEAAITIIESLRTKIASQELRASYFATVQNYYEFYIDLLMRLHKQSPNAGHDGEALQTSERARARSLLETLAEANADIRQGVDSKLVERERTLQIQLNAKAQEQMKLLSGAHTEEQANAIAGEIEALTTEFQQVETQIRQSSPRYAALTQPQPLTLKEIQTNVLDRDTLLLEYSLGAERSYLWAVTPDSITSYELPKRDEIESAARRVYDILNARNQRVEGETPEQRRARIAQADAQYAEAAAQLSGKILTPVAKQLGNKRLLVVADGVLQYIPFAALPDPSAASAPLVVKHEIVSLPSASTISVLRREIKDRKPAAKAVAVLADPVFEETDERVKSVESGTTTAANRQRQRTRRRRDLPLGMERSLEESGLRDAGFEIPRLPGTRLEAGQILALVPQSESKQAFDFAASRATATASDLAQYRFIHFATHGFLNSLHPELSGIVLSMVDEQGKAQDGFLRANDIFNLKLPAELVVLSACQTGLGKEIKGEGLVGLTRGFMYAGAPRVVVSLWSVSDAGTAELMTRFYRAMLKDKMRPAEALRTAQVSLLKEKRWEQPFYWAAFTLQGEWR
jgi:CHAT domain-containing protein